MYPKAETAHYSNAYSQGTATPKHPEASNFRSPMPQAGAFYSPAPPMTPYSTGATGTPSMSSPTNQDIRLSSIHSEEELESLADLTASKITTLLKERDGNRIRDETLPTLEDLFETSDESILLKKGIEFTVPDFLTALLGSDEPSREKSWTAAYPPVLGLFSPSPLWSRTTSISANNNTWNSAKEPFNFRPTAHRRISERVVRVEMAQQSNTQSFSPYSPQDFRPQTNMIEAQTFIPQYFSGVNPNAARAPLGGFFRVILHSFHNVEPFGIKISRLPSWSRGFLSRAPEMTQGLALAGVLSLFYLDKVISLPDDEPEPVTTGNSSAGSTQNAKDSSAGQSMGNGNGNNSSTIGTSSTVNGSSLPSATSTIPPSSSAATSSSSLALEMSIQELYFWFFFAFCTSEHQAKESVVRSVESVLRKFPSYFFPGNAKPAPFGQEMLNVFSELMLSINTRSTKQNASSIADLQARLRQQDENRRISGAVRPNTMLSGFGSLNTNTNTNLSQNQSQSQSQNTNPLGSTGSHNHDHNQGATTEQDASLFSPFYNHLYHRSLQSASAVANPGAGFDSNTTPFFRSFPTQGSSTMSFDSNIGNYYTSPGNFASSTIGSGQGTVGTMGSSTSSASNQLSNSNAMLSFTSQFKTPSGLAVRSFYAMISGLDTSVSLCMPSDFESNEELVNDRLFGHGTNSADTFDSYDTNSYDIYGRYGRYGTASPIRGVTSADHHGGHAQQSTPFHAASPSNDRYFGSSAFNDLTSSVTMGDSSGTRFEDHVDGASSKIYSMDGVFASLPFLNIVNDNFHAINSDNGVNGVNGVNSSQFMGNTNNIPERHTFREYNDDPSASLGSSSTTSSSSSNQTRPLPFNTVSTIITNYLSTVSTSFAQMQPQAQAQAQAQTQTQLQPQPGYPGAFHGASGNEYNEFQNNFGLNQGMLPGAGSGSGATNPTSSIYDSTDNTIRQAAITNPALLTFTLSHPLKNGGLNGRLDGIDGASLVSKSLQQNNVLSRPGSTYWSIEPHMITIQPLRLAYFRSTYQHWIASAPYSLDCLRAICTSHLVQLAPWRVHQQFIHSEREKIVKKAQFFQQKRRPFTEFQSKLLADVTTKYRKHVRMLQSRLAGTSLHDTQDFLTPFEDESEDDGENGENGDLSHLSPDHGILRKRLGQSSFLSRIDRRRTKKLRYEQSSMGKYTTFMQNVERKFHFRDLIKRFVYSGCSKSLQKQFPWIFKKLNIDPSAVSSAQDVDFDLDMESTKSKKQNKQAKPKPNANVDTGAGAGADMFGSPLPSNPIPLPFQSPHPSNRSSSSSSSNSNPFVGNLRRKIFGKRVPSAYQHSDVFADPPTALSYGPKILGNLPFYTSIVVDLIERSSTTLKSSLMNAFSGVRSMGYPSSTSTSTSASASASTSTDSPGNGDYFLSFTGELSFMYRPGYIFHSSIANDGLFETISKKIHSMSYAVESTFSGNQYSISPPAPASATEVLLEHLISIMKLYLTTNGLQSVIQDIEHRAMFSQTSNLLTPRSSSFNTTSSRFHTSTSQPKSSSSSSSSLTSGTMPFSDEIHESHASDILSFQSSHEFSYSPLNGMLLDNSIEDEVYYNYTGRNDRKRAQRITELTAQSVFIANIVSSIDKINTTYTPLFPVFSPAFYTIMVVPPNLRENNPSNTTEDSISLETTASELYAQLSKHVSLSEAALQRLLNPYLSLPSHLFSVYQSLVFARHCRWVDILRQTFIQRKPTMHFHVPPPTDMHHIYFLDKTCRMQTELILLFRALHPFLETVSLEGIINQQTHVGTIAVDRSQNDLTLGRDSIGSRLRQRMLKSRPFVKPSMWKLSNWSSFHLAPRLFVSKKNANVIKTLSKHESSNQFLSQDFTEISEWDCPKKDHESVLLLMFLSWLSVVVLGPRLGYAKHYGPRLRIFADVYNLLRFFIISIVLSFTLWISCKIFSFIFFS